MLTKTSCSTHYQTIGDPNKPAVVLIHGLGLNQHCWQWHTGALAKHFYVVTYDLLGHGGSALPQKKPSLSAFSEQIRQLLQQLSVEKCHLVGFSLGGMINRRFALDYPDKVMTLAILNSPHTRSAEAQKKAEERLQQSTGGITEILNETIQRWFSYDYIEIHSGIIELIKQWLTDNHPENYQQCREVLIKGVTELAIERISDHPTLVITAENDIGSTPEMSYAISHQFDHSKTIIVPKLKHMALIEQPQVFTQSIIDFILSPTQH